MALDTTVTAVTHLIKSAQQKNALSAGLYKKYQDQEFTDCTLFVGKRAIHCHKTVLAAASPVFDMILKANINSNCVIMLDSTVTYEVARCAVEFIYKGEAEVQKDKLLEFIAFGMKQELAGMEDIISQFLGELGSLKNITTMTPLHVTPLNVASSSATPTTSSAERSRKSKRVSFAAHSTGITIKPQPAHVTGDSTPPRSPEDFVAIKAQTSFGPSIPELLTAPSQPDKVPEWDFYDFALSSTLPRHARAAKRKSDGAPRYNRSIFEAVKDRPLQEQSLQLPKLTPSPAAGAEGEDACNFCFKAYKKKKELLNHERECLDNPDHVLGLPTAKFEKSHEKAGTDGEEHVLSIEMN